MCFHPRAEQQWTKTLSTLTEPSTFLGDQGQIVLSEPAVIPACGAPWGKQLSNTQEFQCSCCRLNLADRKLLMYAAGIQGVLAAWAAFLRVTAGYQPLIAGDSSVVPLLRHAPLTAQSLQS